MDERTSLRYEWLSAWCGPLFVLIFVATFGVLGQNLPGPPSPSLSAADISSHYNTHLGSLRLGWVLSLVFISLYLPWSAQISTQMRRIEEHSRVLSYVQLIAGGLTVFVVSFGMLCWAVASFRPERHPEITQMLHDIGWLSLELQWCITTVQMVAMALVGLADKRSTPLFPNWVCWLAIWCGLTFVPASLTLYFKSGPFAWSGWFGFYIPYAAWLVWCVVSSVFMSKEVSARRAALDAHGHIEGTGSLARR